MHSLSSWSRLGSDQVPSRKPARGFGVLPLVALLVVIALGWLGGPASAAQGNVGGEDFTLVSLAAPNDGASHAVGFTWTPGTAQVAYRLLRMADDSRTTASIAVNPTLRASLNYAEDAVPAGTARACYQLVTLGFRNDVLGRSDVLCVAFGTGTNTIETRVTLDENASLRLTWDAVPGAASYLIQDLTSGQSEATGSTSAPIATNGQFACAVVVALGAQGQPIGSSSALCAYPAAPPVDASAELDKFTPTPTPTSTLTATVTSTATGANPRKARRQPRRPRCRPRAPKPGPPPRPRRPRQRA